MSSTCLSLVEKVAALLIESDQMVCTAESCTGGLIAESLTDLAESSTWFERGFVTYSNEAKSEMLSVPSALIDEYGAVSESVANAMVTGALSHSAADYAVAVTGVAGPGGGSVEKPVGTVWVGIGNSARKFAHRYQYPGDRDAVRQASLHTALHLLVEMLEAG